MSYHTHLTVDSVLRTLLKRTGHIGLGIGAFTPMLALANPSGGQVVAGTATIKNPNANTTVVNQSSASAIIDWQQFNIGKGQYVQFLQPSSSSVILNRVIGGGGTSIFGSLTGNGQVFLVNTNGVFFGKGSSIDARGFLVSTLDIADSDFLAGHYLFDKGSNADAQVVNQGSITAHESGYVVLAGDYVENDGLISAHAGHIVLASGSKATLTLSGNSLVSYAINQATLAQLAGATNAGKLQADGGSVLMTADVANLLKATVVNNTGLIEAHAIMKRGASISLIATGGNIQNSGTLDASAIRSGIQGGAVLVQTDGLLDLAPTSKILALGDAAKGGDIEFHAADAKFGGQFEAGKAGNILLDPASITIKTGTGGATNTFGTAQIATAINSGAGILISAGTHIGHSSNAHGVTATGTGTLTLKVGNNGTIALKGFSISIKSNLVSTLATGATKATESFGAISAANVSLNAGSGAITFTKAATGKPSVKATTNASITAHTIAASSGSLNISAASNLTLKALGGAGGANTLLIQPANAIATTGSVNRSITLHAGKDLLMSGHKVDIEMGKASASASSKAAAVTAKDNITISAGHNVTITGGAAGTGSVLIGRAASSGSEAVAKVSGNTNATVSVTAQADISITAGNDIGINGRAVNILGGNVVTDVTTNKTAQAATVTGSATITLGATHNLDISGGAKSVRVQGGIDAVGAQVTASNSKAKATATAHGDVNLTGGNAINIVSAQGILLRGGSSIGGARSSHSTHVVGTTSTLSKKYVPTRVTAGGKLASATLTATANINVNAGIGGANFSAAGGSGKGILLTGGSNVAADASVHAGGNSAHATETAQAEISVATTGAMTLKVTGADPLLVRGGKNTAGVDVSSFKHFSSSGRTSLGTSFSTQHGVTQANAKLATASVTANTGVTLKSGTTMTMSAGGNVAVQAGISAAHSAHVEGSYGGAATLTDVTNIALTAKGAFTAKAGGSLAFSGGVAAAHKVHVDANLLGGKATFIGDDSLSLTAVGVALSAGAATLGIVAGAASDAKSASVNARGAATASLTNISAITITDTGTLTIKSTVGGMQLAGALRSDGAVASVNALGAGANANMTVNGGLNISATAMTFKGNGAISFAGGASGGSHGNLANARVNASSGAHANVIETSALNINDIGAFSASASHGSVVITGGRRMNAAGLHAGAVNAGVATVKADGSATLKAGGNININAGGGSVYLGGGLQNNASSASALASINGVTTVTSLTNLSITAGGDLIVHGHAGSSSGVFVRGGAQVARNATAQGKLGGKATLTADGSVTLSAKHVTLASNLSGSVDIRGGVSAAQGAKAIGTKGTAALSAKSGVTITAANAFTASLAGAGTIDDVVIEGGSHAGSRASANATAGGIASLTGSAGVHVTVTGAAGTITVTTGTRTNGGVQIGGGSNVGHSAVAFDSNGGAATLTLMGNAGLSALGAVAITAGKGSLDIFGGLRGVGHKATATAKLAGSKATDTIDASVAIKAASLTLTGGSGINIEGGLGIGGSSLVDGNHMTATAVGALANAAVSETTAVSIADTGAFTATAGNNLAIFADLTSNGANDKAVANQAGNAQTTANGSVNITAGSVALTATAGILSINGGGGHNGAFASLSASNAGKTAVKALDMMTIKATGALTANAGSKLLMHGGATNDGRSASLFAGNGGVAAASADASLHIAAKSVVLDAHGASVALRGGANAGSRANAYASHAGKATLNANASLNITALTSFQLNMSGSLGKGSLFIEGGNSAAKREHATAFAKGTTAVTTNAGASITVTGTAGTLTVNGGTYASGGKHSIGGGNKGASSSARALASLGGHATLTESDGVILKAPGAVSLKTTNGNMNVFGGAKSNAKGAIAQASDVSAAATLTQNSGITVSGSTVTVTAGGKLRIYAGSLSNAKSARATANSHGVAKLSANDAVSITATGAFTASGSAMSIAGGLGGTASAATKGNGESARAVANHNATAGLTATDGLTIKAGGAVTLTAKTGALSIDGGLFNDGRAAKVSASNQGAATLTEATNVSITGSAITAVAKTNLFVYGAKGSHGRSDQAKSSLGGGAANVSINGGVALTAAGAVGLTAQSGSLSIYGGLKNNALKGKATGNNGGKAVNQTLDNVTITAGGAFSATAKNKLLIYGGSKNGSSANVTGLHGGAGNLTVDGSVAIKGKGITLTATNNNLFVHGGFDDGFKAKASGSDVGGLANLTTKSGVTLNAGVGNLTAAAGGSLHLNGSGNDARSASVKGIHHGAAALTADDSVTVTGATVALNAAGLGLSIAGANSEARNIAGRGSDFGKATLTAKGGVNITATAFTAALSGSHLASSAHLNILGGANLARSAGRGASILGTVGAITTVNADASVNIKVTTGALSVTMGAKYLKDNMAIHGGSGDEFHAHVQAASAGVANIAGTSRVNLTTPGAVTIKTNTATGKIVMHGGSSLASFGRARAFSTGAKANLTGDASLTVSGSAVTLQAGGGMSIYGGAKDLRGSGSFSNAVAASGGVANVQALSRTNITATGALNLIAGGSNLKIDIGQSDAHGAKARAFTGAKTTVTVDASVTLKAGTTLTASGHSITSLHAGIKNDGARASIFASNAAAATLTDTTSLSVTAGGALTVKGKAVFLGTPSLASAGALAKARALNNATATLTDTATLTLKGSAITMSAGAGNMSIHGGVLNGRSASVSASNLAHAAFTVQDNVSIVTAGALKEIATGKLDVTVGAGDGDLAKVHANGKLDSAKMTLNGSVAMSGLTVALSAGGASLAIHGGQSAGKGATLTASNSGAATLTDNAQTAITAVKSFAAQLTGSSASHVISILGGAAAAQGLSDTAKIKGTATAVDNANVAIKVSGTGGTVTINTGKVTNAIVLAAAGNSAAAAVIDSGSAGGIAAVTDTAGVSITALGAFNVGGSHARLSIHGGHQQDARSASVHASGTGGVAKLTDTDSITLSGGAVSLQAGRSASFYGAKSSNARSAGVRASNGGAAAFTADTSLSVTATGSLTVTAGGSLVVFGSQNGRSDAITATGVGAKATLSALSNVNFKATGGITVSAATSLKLFGDAADGQGAGVHGSNHGMASYSALGNLNITAGGGVTLSAAGAKLSIAGGNAVGSRDSVTGAGTAATAKAVAQGNVNIAAKTTVSITGGAAASDTIKVLAGNNAVHSAVVSGSAAGNANLDAESRVSVTTPGSLTLTGGGTVALSGGLHAGSGTSARVRGSYGVAALTINDNVSMSVGGNMTLTLSNHALILKAGGSAGHSAHYTAAGSIGAATVSINSDVFLRAVGTLTITGALTDTLSAGAFTAPVPVMTTLNGGKDKATLNESVTLAGVKSLSVGTPTQNPTVVTSASGLREMGSVNLLTGAAASARTQSVMPPAAAQVILSGQDLALVPLGEQGLVVNLETVMGPAEGACGLSPTQAGGCKLR